MEDLGVFITQSASDALQAVFAAGHARARAGKKRTHLAHLLDQLLDEESLRAKVPENVRARARSALAEQIQSFPSDSDLAGKLAFDLEALTGPAVEMMRTLESPKVTPVLFLAACLSESIALDPQSERSREILRLAGLTAEMFLPGATERARRQDFTFRSSGFADGLGTDITAMARAGYWASCPLVGMEEALENLVVVLNSMRYSAAIVGEPGVGKSAFIQGFAWHLVHRTRPLITPDMDSWTVVRIEAPDLLKGTSGRGELESRVKDTLSFFIRNPTVVPFFEEVHKLLDTDDASSRTVATAFKVPMADERFRCVGVTTDREYARFIANDEAMNSRFRKILLPEPNQEQAGRIINGIRGHLLRGKAAEFGVSFSDDAVRTAVRVTSTYQKSDRLPRKAINLLGETVNEKVYRLGRVDAATQPAPPSKIVTGEDVARFFSKVTGIPVDDLNENCSVYYRRLQGQLKQRVRGQDHAVDSVTGHLELYAVGYLDRRRPRGRFLFLGPPGVGKTELAISLAEEVMRDGGSLVTVNMAEYTKEDSLNKFMGASPGYIGFGQTPTIYSKVMMRPFSVVVLDEFEKAAPELANPLLAMLDGRGEDSQGRPVDFSQCIFVLTSNAFTARDMLAAAVRNQLRKSATDTKAANLLQALGLRGLSSSATDSVAADQVLVDLGDEDVDRLLTEIGGADEEAMRAHLLSIGGIWTPPLVDRIDRIALFRPLDGQALWDILDRMIKARQEVASRPLPAGIETKEVRQGIIQWATREEYAASARRLERSLVRWLAGQARGGAGDVQDGSEGRARMAPVAGIIER